MSISYDDNHYTTGLQKKKNYFSVVEVNTCTSYYLLETIQLGLDLGEMDFCFFGETHMLEEFTPSFFLGMNSNASEKSMNHIVASRIFAPTVLMIRLIIRIYDVIDWFLQMPFWFFLEFTGFQIGYNCEAGQNKLQ